MDEEDKQERKEIPQSEWEMVFSGPAPVINRMHVNNLQAGMRLTFSEQYSDVVPPVFRAAVFLSYDDAEALRNLLDRQLSTLQKVEIHLDKDGNIVQPGQ
jgi:hypothetical protein